MARPSLFAVLVAALVPGAAAAETFTGEIVATQGRRTDDGAQIVTDATVRLADGSEIVVTALGGHVDGKTMVVFHGPPPLETGLRIRVTGAAAAGGARRWLASDVTVLAGPGGLPYVRTLTKKSGKPLYWEKSCAEVWWANEGTTAIPGDEERAVIEQALGEWNQEVAGCSYMNLVGKGPTTKEVGEDEINLIKFRDTTWCRPAVGNAEPHCHAANAAGITTVVYVDDPDNARDGEIVDADVELNGTDFAISINGQTQSGQFCKADLANTLVHELGHLLGLEHTCRKATDPPRTDASGADLPLCTATNDPVITEATMYPQQDCGETKKADLSDDDVAAMCEVYPLADDPGECGPPDDLHAGCCSAGGGAGAGAGSALLAAATLGLLVSRRRLSGRLRRSALRRSPGRP